MSKGGGQSGGAGIKDLLTAGTIHPADLSQTGRSHSLLARRSRGSHKYSHHALFCVATTLCPPEVALCAIYLHSNQLWRRPVAARYKLLSPCFVYLCCFLVSCVTCCIALFCPTLSCLILHCCLSYSPKSEPATAA